MNIKEIIINNITITISIILVLIIICLVISLLSIRIYNNKYNDLLNQNEILNEQVQSYTNNLAKLYEQERFIDEPDIQHVEIPDVDDINKIPDSTKEVVGFNNEWSLEKFKKNLEDNGFECK